MANSQPPHPVRRIKGLTTPPNVVLSTNQAARFFWKLLYEFWGFSVNGQNNLLVPGGFAALSGTSLPPNFESGTTLLATGSDGMTAFGTNIFVSDSTDFNALNVTGSLSNKYLTIWREDAPNNDDSVYRIIGVQNANAVIIDVATGGSTRLGGKAYFSDRSNVKFRITDPVASTQLAGWGADHYMVLNFDAAPNVNEGQLISQLRIDLTESQQRIQLQASPAGTWNGSSFSDASSYVSSSWFSASESGKGKFLFLGGKDFLVCTLKGTDTAWGSVDSPSKQPGFHVEIPRRLYPRVNDPNPITWTIWDNSAGLHGVSQTTGSYANGFKMVCDDGVTRDWITTARVPAATGDHVSYAITPASGGLYGGFNFGAIYANSLYNPFSASYMTTDAVLMQTGSLSDLRYAPNRVKLRRVRFTTPNMPPNTRLGEYWIHIGGGIMWSWDGSESPFGVFPMNSSGIGGGYEPG